MKQNIYDNETFYRGYLDLRLQGKGLNDVLEIPAFRSLLPETLQNLHILDLGCGFGEACAWYASQGAAKVTGVDISEKMLARAKQYYQHKAIDYIHMPIEDIAFEKEQFDLVLSSLAFHYVADFRSLCEQIHVCLKKGGFLIFSQEHPVATANKKLAGWAEDKNGEKLYWMLDNYGEEGMRKQHWFIDGVIKYHRTLATVINTLLETGFRITQVLEPSPLAEAEKHNKSLRNECRRPPFLMVKAQKE